MTDLYKLKLFAYENIDRTQTAKFSFVNLDTYVSIFFLLAPYTKSSSLWVFNSSYLTNNSPLPGISGYLDTPGISREGELH